MIPFVSVILPNYNHAPFLEQRIETILNQTFQDFELIILDDCSTDNSKEIIERYRNHPMVREIIYNQENSGSTFKQWHKGIARATGDWIWIAESDDYCDLNFLDVLSKQLKKDNEISLVYCKSVMINDLGDELNGLNDWYQEFPDSNRWESGYVNEGLVEIRSYLSLKNTIPNASAVIFKKMDLGNTGGILSTFKLSGDWIFWIIAISGKKIAYSVDTQNYFRNHSRTVRNKYDSREEIFLEKLIIYKFLLHRKLMKRRELTGKLKSDIEIILGSKSLHKWSDRVFLFSFFVKICSFDPTLAITEYYRRFRK